MSAVLKAKPAAGKPLFAHQKESVSFLKRSDIVFDTSDPGTGKTRVEVEDFAARRRRGGKCALVMATKSLLESAWQKDFNEFAPDMGVSVAYATNRDKAFECDADVYVTNHDAAKWLAAQPKSFFAKFDTLIIDECFPAGTQVDTPTGPRPIEVLKTGDVVYTSSGAAPVSRIFAKLSDDLVQMELDDGTKITCTGNHPFATPEGWVEARALGGMSVVRLDVRQFDEQRAAVLQQKLRAQGNVGVQEFGREGCNCGEVSSKTTRSPELEQRRPVPGGNEGEIERSAQGDWAFTEDPRRERQDCAVRAHDGGDVAGVLETAGTYSHRESKRQRLSHRVQGGLRACLQKVGYRSGREFTYIAEKLGCEEGQIIGLSRVVSVSRVECASPCMVFNLQVNGPHTYSIAGVLVHNCTAFKHHTSQRSKAVAKITKYFKYRRLLTGTPNGNGICDLWHQIFLLDDGVRLGKSFFGFRAAACIPEQVGPQASMIKWNDRPGIEATVSAMIRDITIRHRFEDCVDIPENHKYAVTFKLGKKHYAQYNDMQDFHIMQLKKTTVTAVNGAVVAGKLLQVASGAVYNDDGEYSLIDSGRYQLVMDLVEERAHSIVFFNWEHQRDELVREAERRGLSFAVYDGSTNDRARAGIVKDYQAGQYRVLFAHPQSAGHGLTLTRGAATIWASPTYNLEHFLQGLKRIHRIGQTERTETIVVVAEGTIDEKVWQSLQDKKVKMADLLEGLK